MLLEGVLWGFLEGFGLVVAVGLMLPWLRRRWMKAGR